MALVNPYAAEPLILARVKEAAPELKTHGSASVLVVRDDILTLCDGVFLIPGQTRVESQAGMAVAVDQDWQIVLAITAVTDLANPDTTAIKAGEYAGKIISALLGWKPGEEFAKMRFTGLGEPLYGDGYAEFPLFFSVKTALKGNTGA